MIFKTLHVGFFKQRQDPDPARSGSKYIDFGSSIIAKKFDFERFPVGNARHQCCTAPWEGGAPPPPAYAKEHIFNSLFFRIVLTLRPLIYTALFVVLGLVGATWSARGGGGHSSRRTAQDPPHGPGGVRVSALRGVPHVHEAGRLPQTSGRDSLPDGAQQ